MKAVRMDNFGDVTLQDIEIPKPKPDEVLVRVRASSINPVDYKIGNGMLSFLAKQPMPLVLGWDVAGDVIETGAFSKAFNPGDRVFAMAEIGLDGTLAEYCVVKRDHLALLPESISYEDAGALPMVLLTAWQALITEGNLHRNQRLLIQQGAGGVGHIAIQLAKIMGAHVIVMTSSKNKAFVESLGADEVIDYEKQDVVSYLAEKPVDLVLESLYGEAQTQAIRVLKPGGKLVSISGLLPETEAAAKEAGVDASFVFVQGDASLLKRATEFIARGDIKPFISQTISLTDFQKGFDQSESGRTRGKIAVTMD
ncbi:NADP-dependent oxidoreductase [Enterovibrio coralii]|uniref:Enoyl reductase (ER) domain-containing protein n=1 Tax=Enterovibrio coralii TaxID=294935 RepID=A0A135I3F3_9GAMM|nr:NADP-dependent oxidoreductase [Enterovibrio coralii]KXF79980.1 hypothetical protein ATN88_12145 [Enterovibrio coralii]